MREAVGNQNNDFGAVPAHARRSGPIYASAGTWGRTAFPRPAGTSTNWFSDANEFSFQSFFPGAQWLHTDIIRDWAQLDMFYTYRDFEYWGGSFNFTVGARNLTDRMPQRTGMIAGVVASLQDPLGRVIYCAGEL